MLAHDNVLACFESQPALVAAIGFGWAAADPWRPDSDVDLIVLNRASTILAFQAVKTGTVVHGRDRRVLDRFIVRLITEYADCKIMRRPIEGAVIARRVLAEG